MIFGKKGAAGESIMMIYRIIIVSFIAFIVLGVFSIFYEHHIDVRDVEAQIMAREVVDCLAPAGILYLEDYPSTSKNNLLFYCGFENFDGERFFVNAVINQSNPPKNLDNFYQGDSGASWIKEIFKNKPSAVNNLKKYEPGSFRETYPVFINSSNNLFEGIIDLEVFVNHE